MDRPRPRARIGWHHPRCGYGSACFWSSLWMLPFWALAPSIAHFLSGLSNPPTVAVVTTTIVVVQTILGLIGLWVAGTQVKSIIKGTTKRQALRALWSILLHGETRDQGSSTMVRSRRGPRKGLDTAFGEEQAAHLDGQTYGMSSMFSRSVKARHASVNRPVPVEPSRTQVLSRRGSREKKPSKPSRRRERRDSTWPAMRARP